MSRRHLIGLTVFIASAIVSAGPIRAAGPRDSLVVTADWVAEHLKDRNLVVLHSGMAESYKAEHIPGAQFITMDDVSAPMDHANMKPADITTEMPDPARMRETLQRFGISDNSRIVIYYSDKYYSPTTRIIFALNWAGLGDKVVLMQGGLPAWKLGGRVTTAAVPAVQPGTLSPIKPHTELIADVAFVQTKALTPGFALVDGRARSAYDGVPPPAGRAGQPPAPVGHIPGAHSAPFVDMFNENGELRPASELELVFSNAGVKPGDTVVGYCWVGMQATAMLFAARTLGHPVKLYDGSINEWTVKNLPLETVKK